VQRSCAWARQFLAAENKGLKNIMQSAPVVRTMVRVTHPTLIS
jgi:hypothetical protein